MAKNQRTWLGLSNCDCRRSWELSLDDFPSPVCFGRQTAPAPGHGDATPLVDHKPVNLTRGSPQTLTSGVAAGRHPGNLTLAQLY